MTAKKSPATVEHLWRLATVDGVPVAVCSCGKQSDPLPSVVAAAEWAEKHVATPKASVDDEDEG